MEQIIKKVLKKIENCGFEAYIVGGYVRDLFLNRKTFDIDICTNALPKELVKIFPSGAINEYGGINLKYKKYNFDITTYRKENKYINRRPVEIEYVNNLFEDIKRRDFTINAICMDSKGYILDLVEGISAINQKNILMIGDLDAKLTEDPLRILRAIRFMTILNFNLDESLKNAIIKHKEQLSNLSPNRIKEELDKILINKNALYGVEQLKELGIFDVLGINANNITYVADKLGMWAQLDFSFNSAFTKEEKNNIINIRKILKNESIDIDILFNFGLYLTSVAGEILKINKGQIIKMYKLMPIHDKQEIVIMPGEIIEILEVKPSDKIGKIYNDITYEILHKRLKNNYQDIKKYILAKKEMWLK